MINKVTPLLSSLSNIKINRFHIDPKTDTIKLNLNNDSISEIIFNDVLSFYYMDNDDSIPDDNNNISLNNIMYCEVNNNEHFNIPNGEEGDVNISIPNFVLELSDSAVFIEANSITIDQKEYLV